MLDEIVSDLAKKLLFPLPGISAHELMMPAESTRARFDLNKKDVRRGGVLILLYPKDGRVFMPLTQRHDYGGTHGGQVSLPGGKLEQIDENITQTALRETHEEIGVDPEEIEVIGRLTDLYIPPSNFRVTPIVGYVKNEPVFKIDPYEVAELIEAPLVDLLDLSKRKEKEILVRNNYKLKAPYFDIEGRVVWGATAMILSEFHELISDL